MVKKLNSREALYGFVAWLTCSPKTIRLGASNDCAPIVQMIERFANVNKLPKVRKTSWPQNLTHPKEVQPNKGDKRV